MAFKTFYTVFKTPLGWMAVLGSSAGLRRTTLPQQSLTRALSLLGDSYKEAALSPVFFKDVVRRFRLYFSGHTVAFPDTLDLRGRTDFRCRVWEATRKITYGQTRSYRQIAQQIGEPEAAQAVGQALERNPLPIIIPCHRVINSNGTPGGFSGGLALKKRLLALEKSAGK